MAQARAVPVSRGVTLLQEYQCQCAATVNLNALASLFKFELAVTKKI